MTKQSLFVWDVHTAQNQLPAFGEPVNIESCANAHFHGQILLRGNLDIGVIPLCQRNGMSQPLHQRGIIGSPKPVFLCLPAGFFQHLAEKALRGLHLKQGASVQRTASGDGGLLQFLLPDGILAGHHRNCRADGFCPAKHCLDDSIRNKGPRPVVDQHQLSVRHCRHGCIHRILPLPPAGQYCRNLGKRP